MGLTLRGCSCTLASFEQRGQRSVPVPPSPHVKAVSWINRDRGLRVRACFRWRCGADENTHAYFRMGEGG